MQTLVLVAKLTALSLSLIFGFLFLATDKSDLHSKEVVTVLDGTDKTKVGQYLVFNGEAHPLPERMYFNGHELFYQIKKGDAIRVVTDTGGFVASLHVYGEQVYDLQKYSAWKKRRAERWLNLSKWFFAGFIFFYFLGLRGKNNE